MAFTLAALVSTSTHCQRAPDPQPGRSPQATAHEEDNGPPQTKPADEPAGAPTTRPSASGVDHRAFDTILGAAVRNERVDYLDIRKSHWTELTGYLERLARADRAALPRNERLAYDINLYNATMIRAVIERLRTDWSAAAHDFGVFDAEIVRTGGRTISLNALEHDIIRPEYSEPRIHVALVCGARSCPPLVARAYRADDIDAALENRMRDFVNDPFRNELDHDRNTMSLSQIFNWYAADFGGRDAIRSYVGRYLEDAPDDLASWTVAFREYSWALNIAPPRSGRWIAVEKGGTTLRSGPGSGADVRAVERGEIFEVTEERDGWLRVDDVPFENRTAEAVWVEAGRTLPYVVVTAPKEGPGR